MEQTAAFWDRAAERYAKSQIKDPRSYAYTLGRTRTYLRPTDRVLELGAGTGSTAIELAPFVAHITATDISPEMVEIGREKAKDQGVSNIDFAVSESAVPELSGPYDVILAHNLLHLVEDLPVTLERAHALLKSQGLFISKTFCKPKGLGTPYYYFIRLVLPVMQAFGKAPFVAMLSIEDLENSIASAGFDLLETGDLPVKDVRRYVVARKA